MGKISPVSIKYVIHANFSSQGGVEKPDVIGALFGQTEGLLGSSLEMRELQKEGKIGRIDVDLKNEDGKTVGKILIPTALDKAETALIGAAIETIDRIGPTEAKIEIEKIEDTRGEKRNFIVDRAKKLLEQIHGSQDTREITDDLRVQERMGKLTEYSDERLPAGDISGHEIIVVEGRADVITLLKNGVDNVIGMNGTKLPEAVKKLSYDKEITLFVDGDRGGVLIAKNVCDNARVDYIAVAPDGKEVEELVGKEILIALRKKVPARDFFRYGDRQDFRRDRYDRFNGGGYRYNRDDRYGNDRFRRFERREDGYREAPREEVKQEVPIKQEVPAPVQQEPVAEVKKETDIDKEKLKAFMSELEGTKEALLLDAELGKIKSVSSKSLAATLKRTKKDIYAIVMDGIVTAEIVGLAEERAIKAIAARNFAYTATSIKLISV